MAGASNPRRANGHRRSKLLAAVKASGEPCWICQLPIDSSIKAGEPCACEADEITPVSKGGSALDRGNVRASHRCCNNWRGDRSEAFVDAIRSKVQAAAAYDTPEGFVALAKRAAKNKSMLTFKGTVRHTTDW